MGYFKTLYTEIYSSRGSRKGRARRLARQAEEQIQEQIRMSFATEDEFRAWQLCGMRRRWNDCTACPLHHGRSRVVFGEGGGDPRLLVIGEAPGANEDRRGRPFVGDSGILLRRMCRALGIDLHAQDVYVTNSALCRPPRNRRPTKDEREACRARLDMQVEILRPQVVLLLGGTAAHWVGLRSVGDNRGLVSRRLWPPLGEARAALLAVVLTYHPAWILRKEGKGARRRAVKTVAADLRKVARVLEVIEARGRTKAGGAR